MVSEHFLPFFVCVNPHQRMFFFIAVSEWKERREGDKGETLMGKIDINWLLPACTSTEPGTNPQAR